MTPGSIVKSRASTTRSALTFLDRAQLPVDTQDLGAVRAQDLHRLHRAEAGLDEQLVVAPIAKTWQRAADARGIYTRRDQATRFHDPMNRRWNSTGSGCCRIEGLITRSEGYRGGSQSSGDRGFSVALRDREAVLDTLSYLKDRLDGPVLSRVLRALQALPISGLARMEYKLRNRRTGRLGRLLALWFNYRRATDMNLLDTANGFRDFANIT